MLQDCGGLGIGRRFSGLCSKGTDAKGRTSSSISCDDVAQEVEHQLDKPRVVGSIPTVFLKKKISESVRH